jgi:hypothetical protein
VSYLSLHDIIIIMYVNQIHITGANDYLPIFSSAYNITIPTAHVQADLARSALENSYIKYIISHYKGVHATISCNIHDIVGRTHFSIYRIIWELCMGNEQREKETQT